MSADVRARAVVSGHVQGVGFRYETRARARSLRLRGWVRNRSDGRVEAVFEGSRHAVESMLEWCRCGPAGSRVDSCTVTWEQPRGEPEFGVG